MQVKSSLRGVAIERPLVESLTCAILQSGTGLLHPTEDVCAARHIVDDMMTRHLVGKDAWRGIYANHRKADLCVRKKKPKQQFKRTVQTEAQQVSLEEVLGYTFCRKELLRTAAVHSYAFYPLCCARSGYLARQD
jgi:hypothetical protein